MGAPRLFGDAFRGTRVLVTGHTGFKGSWLTRWLLDLGAEVTGLALEPDTTPSLFDDLGLQDHVAHHVGDIRDAALVESIITAAQPEVVLHLAAQPLVRRAYAEPVYTFEVNAVGTANVLEAVRATDSVRAVVSVTTDKVYKNPETGHPFTEDEPLGGHDPYSASKACAEIVTASFRDSFFASGGPAVATARAGNVIGGGDWAEDRIVPDCVRALAAAGPIAVRNPGAVRPWQHVVEPLSGYLRLAQLLLEDGRGYAEAFNFGPDPEGRHTVADVVEAAIGVWGSGEWHRPELGVQPHEAGLLTLNVDKAADRLGWTPLWDFDETIARTVGWYREYAVDRSSAVDSTISDIEHYVATARLAGARWA